MLRFALCVCILSGYAGDASAQTGQPESERKPWHIDVRDPSSPAQAQQPDNDESQPRGATPWRDEQPSEAPPTEAPSEAPAESSPAAPDTARSPDAAKTGEPAAPAAMPGAAPEPPAASNHMIGEAIDDEQAVPMLPELQVITGKIELLRDKDEQWGIDDVSSPAFADRFTPLNSAHIQLEPTEGPVWLRITVDNRAPYSVERAFAVFESSIDRVALYAANPDGTFDISQAGRLVPYGQQDLVYRFPAVTYTVGPNARRVIYINAASSLRRGMVLHTGETDEIRRRFLLDAMLLGLFYGALGAMLFYNLFLSIFVGMRSYLGYVVYLVMLGACTFMIDGLDRLLTTWHLNSLQAGMYAEIFGIIALASLIEFSRRFMKLDEHLPWANKTLIVLSALALTGVPGAMFVPNFEFPVVTLFTLLTLAFILGCAVAIRVRGERPTRFFALSFCALFLGVSAELVASWVLTNGPGVSNATLLTMLDLLSTTGLRFGTGLEMILLSLALADQINVLRQEKELAQSEALRSLQHTADMKDAYSRRLERRVLERTQALERAKEQAEAATFAKSRFLATISHEIRTPMTAILGFAELLDSKEITEAQRRDFVHTIERNGHHLLALINDILDLSKIEANQLQLHPEQVSPVDLVNDVFSLMRVRSEKAGLTLKATFQGKIPQHIVVDALRLRQILLNLLGNAIKFTEQGEIELSVRLGPSEAHPELLFTISDTGVGMTSDQLSRLFQPFNQGDSSVTRRFGGTGLGLAISKRLALLMDGDLTASSEPGAGSRFTLAMPMPDLATLTLYHPATTTLISRPGKQHHAVGEPVEASFAQPIEAIPTWENDFDVYATPTSKDHDATDDDAAPRTQPAGEPATASHVSSNEDGNGDGPRHTNYISDDPLPAGFTIPPASASAPPRKARVLLAEDGVDNQRLIGFILRRAGIEVTIAENGQQAVDLVLPTIDTDDAFDLILMDIQMPVLDGTNATAIIREAGYVGPIVALTAHAMKGDRELCLAAGCDDFATKPIDRETFMQKIEQYLTAKT